MRSFYVYELVDPRNGKPFYVGKGSGRRAYNHAAQVKLGKATGNTRKDARIIEILAAGHEVIVRKLAEYDNEPDALDHEYRIVQADPNLTNAACGSGGPSLRADTLRRLQETRARERHKAIERDKVRKIAEFTSLKNADRSAGDIAVWVAGLGAESGIFRRPQRTMKERRADRHRERVAANKRRTNQAPKNHPCG